MLAHKLELWIQTLIEIIKFYYTFHSILFKNFESNENYLLEKTVRLTLEYHFWKIFRWNIGGLQFYSMKRCEFTSAKHKMMQLLIEVKDWLRVNCEISNKIQYLSMKVLEKVLKLFVKLTECVISMVILCKGGFCNQNIVMPVDLQGLERFLTQRHLMTFHSLHAFMMTNST